MTYTVPHYIGGQLINETDAPSRASPVRFQSPLR